MKTFLVSVIVALAFLIVPFANAQAPTGSSGECKDGTYTSAESKRGACAGHGGVKDWFSTKAEKKDTGVAAVPSMSAPVKPPPTAAPNVAPGKSAATPMPTVAAAGGGPGQVWVNSSSKVYHCPTDKWYGKTKHGEYMTEAAAKAAGNRADHGKVCS